MERPSVYVETSVVSAYDDERTDWVTLNQRAITRRWWDEYRDQYDLFSSQAVVEELSRCDFPGRATALRMVDEMVLLPVTEEVAGAASTYMERFVMPKDAMGDALHLALASVHEVDILVTWNCKHLANANKFRHIQTVNLRLGLLTPQMVTPQMLQPWSTP